MECRFLANIKIQENKRDFRMWWLLISCNCTLGQGFLGKLISHVIIAVRFNKCCYHLNHISRRLTGSDLTQRDVIVITVIVHIHQLGDPCSKDRGRSGNSERHRWLAACWWRTWIGCCYYEARNKKRVSLTGSFHVTVVLHLIWNPSNRATKQPSNQSDYKVNATVRLGNSNCGFSLPRHSPHLMEYRAELLVLRRKPLLIRRLTCLEFVGQGTALICDGVSRWIAGLEDKAFANT